MKTTYRKPVIKVKSMDIEPLLAASADVNAGGTEVVVPGTGGGGDASGAHSKRATTIWDDNNEE